MKCPNPDCPFSQNDELKETCKFCFECGFNLRQHKKTTSAQNENTAPLSEDSKQVAAQCDDLHCNAKGSNDQADEQQEKQLEEVDDKSASEESGESSSGQSTLVADSTASPLENLALETKSGEQRKTEHCGFSGGNISQKLNPQEPAGYNSQGKRNREHMQAPKGNGDDPEVCLDPVAGSARSFPTYPGGPQTCISNALEVANTGAQGDQDSVSSNDQSPDSNSQINLQQVKNTHYFAGPGAQYQKIFSATQQASCTQPDRWNGNVVGSNQRGFVNWSSMSQEDKYKTCILEVPFRLLREIYLSLDVKRTDGKDVRLFAEKLGLTHREYEFVCQEAQIKCQSPTFLLLKENFNLDSVRKFIEIMKSMDREDIITHINDWQS